MNCKTFECKSLVENAKLLKILYVKNKDSEDGLISEVFEKVFKEVDIATSLSDAIDMFSTDFYDIIMVDTYIDNNSGIELISEIKKVANKKAVVAIGVDKNSDDLIKLINIGINAYIFLPSHIDELVHILNRVCLNVTEYNMLTQFGSLLEKSYDEIAKQKSQLDELLLGKGTMSVELEDSNSMSSNEYLSSMPHYLKDIINDLNEDITDIEEKLNILVASPTLINIQKVALAFNSFAINLDQFDEFTNIVNSSKKVAKIFESMSIEHDFHKYFEMFGLICESFRNWFNRVFIVKNLDNIHDLDRDIIQKCSTLESTFLKK